MTTRTWNGSNASFDTASDWSPNGIPSAGDTAVINSGTVSVNSETLSGIVVSLASSGSNFPTLVLNDATLDPSTRIRGNTGSLAVVLEVNGTVTNQGIATFVSGFLGGQYDVDLANPGPAGTVLHNAGTINAKDGSIAFAAGVNSGAAVVNDGAISVWNPDGALQNVKFGAQLLGSGTVFLHPNVSVTVASTVDSTQTFEFMSASGGNAALEIGTPASFQGTVSGFVSSDFIRLDNAPSTGLVYTPTGAHAGTLTLNNNGTTTASLNLIGDYQTSDFSINNTDLGGGQTLTTIRTSTPIGAGNFKFTDTELNLSGADTGTIYTGPVAGLQKQFLWGSDDNAAISTTAQNVFVKGGSGSDALAVSGGQNVLDGGGGSNFLVGGKGAGSQDTFFVDGRGGVVTWSTIVNFHLGDQATIFGFHAGISTLPFTDDDGVQGFTGITAHSELNGAGTGVNASMTFAGIDRATMDAHFTFTTGTLLEGTPDAIDYLLVQYDH
jgi:hypothetical protein